MVANIMFWRMRICFFCQRDDTALVLTLQLLGSVDGLLVGRRDGEDGAWHHALLPAAAHDAPLDAVAVVQHRAALALVDAHIHLLVVADGRDGGGLPQRLPALLERDHGLGARDELVYGGVELAQLLADVLHFPQELLAVVQTAVRLAVRAVQLFVLTEEDIVIGAILLEIP